MLRLERYNPVEGGGSYCKVGGKYIKISNHRGDWRYNFHPDAFLVLRSYHPDDEEKLLKLPLFEEFLSNLISWGMQQLNFEVEALEEFIDQVSLQVCYQWNDWSVFWSQKILQAYRKYYHQSTRFRFHAIIA